MIIRLIVILISFSLVFNQEKNDNQIKKKQKVFSNNQSTEEYLDVLKKSLDLLITNYVDSINESEVFFSRLKGIKDPEKKRKIIGYQFIQSIDRKASKLCLPKKYFDSIIIFFIFSFLKTHQALC